MRFKKGKIGDQIKVRFKIRGELKPLEDTGDGLISDLIDGIEKSPDVIGIAETPWGEVLKIREDDLIIKLLNEPVYQLDKKGGTQIKWGDICVFEKTDSFPEYVRLALPEEYLK